MEGQILKILRLQKQKGKEANQEQACSKKLMRYVPSFNPT